MDLDEPSYTRGEEEEDLDNYGESSSNPFRSMIATPGEIITSSKEYMRCVEALVSKREPSLKPLKNQGSWNVCRR